jgi:hypothetical protein
MHCPAMKLSDAGPGTIRLKPERSRAIRWSAFDTLDRAGLIGVGRRGHDGRLSFCNLFSL